MVTAQDVVFTKSYWFPALTLAEAMNLHSQVARTIFFDTAVQGGLRRILSQTNSQVPRNLVGERAYLETFLNNRVDYLNTLADKFELSGNTVQAQMLRNSAAGRVGKLQQLLAESDLR